MARENDFNGPEKGWNDSQLRQYDFPTDQLPRFNHKDKIVEELISNRQPFVITDTNLAGPALRWNLDYLKNNIGDGNFSVYQSDNHLFKYFDDKKAHVVDNFVPPTKRLDMKFKEFHELVKTPNRKGKRLYLQQSLNDTVGPEIVRDFVQFNWKWVTAQQQKNNWGPLTSNLLLISEEGNVTPCHYDEQENFFAQIEGLKRVILFPPAQFECLYPYPVYHPHDRQCQVDFENPDYKQFPKFKEARGMEAVLGPGDVLYLPSYWFHHFETLLDSGTATSITFWYKSAPVGQIVYPLKPCQKMAMMRNIEKMISDALVDYRELGPFWETMVVGRYAKDLRGGNT